ncbi:MAG TPA: 6-carboxytetrahydropterin synthase [Actinomycetota bacterium]|nr:6-carboxytetrahydropterin synthase [Actinomycetota bacterium]
MYETGLSKSFVAWHVMPDVDGPEGELHTHDYRLDVVVSRAELDERGMVCDIDVLDAALDEIVAVVAGKNVDVVRPPDAAAVTVEVLARWAHGALAPRLGVDGELSVRAWESPVAFGGYAAPIRS